jgi:hypothetical protein
VLVWAALIEARRATANIMLIIFLMRYVSSWTELATRIGGVV